MNYHGSKTDADSVVAEIETGGGRAKAYQADVSVAAVVNQLIANIKSDLGGLDILEIGRAHV